MMLAHHKKAPGKNSAKRWVPYAKSRSAARANRNANASALMIERNDTAHRWPAFCAEARLDRPARREPRAIQPTNSTGLANQANWMLENAQPAEPARLDAWPDGGPGSAYGRKTQSRERAGDDEQ